MNAGYIKELVKIKTELLKFYFILFVASGTGVATMLARESLSRFHIVLTALGGLVVALVLLLIINLRADIQRHIDELKPPTP